MIYDPEYGLKSNANPIANKVSSLWDLSMQYFRERGADAIILGCTELSLLPHGGRVNNMLIVDSTVCFAKALIREATGVPSPGKLTALTAPNCT
jgi:aspartate racemase